jgi:DNA-binding transcriptional LysR family regulator
VLTTEGKAIYQKAKYLLNQSLELQGLAKHLASGHEAELRLAMSGILPIEPIIQTLNTLDTRFPETRMNLLIESLGGTMERLRDDDADIALTDILEVESDASLESVQFTQIKFVTVVPSASKWAAFADSLTEQDLAAETMIVVRDTSHHSTRISKGIVEGTPQWTVNDFATKQRIICSGKGWGRMPYHLVAQDIKNGILTPLQSPDFKRFFAPIYLVRKKNKPVGTVAQALWLALQKITWTTPQ